MTLFGYIMRHLAWPARKTGGAALELKAVETPGKSPCGFLPEADPYCSPSSGGELQIRRYTQAINAHDGWDLVDIYADEGLTGMRMDKREDFNRLMADCRKGKIDKIVVKSISRFARNTRDCLATLRELSSLGVTVKFEKENIPAENFESWICYLGMPQA